MFLGRYAPVALLALLAWATTARAVEPNNTFEEATVLGPGVLTVDDDLNAPEDSFPPDTIIRALDEFGTELAFDDDDEFGIKPTGYGDEFASALSGVPTDNGEIRFEVSGFGDDDFEGFHDELGDYEFEVFVYDDLGEQITAFPELATLEFSEVDQFFYSSPDYVGGSYDVWIDNVVFGDVDFFIFTGLTPGETFTAETFDPEDSGIDTIIAWLDDSGTELGFNDDGDVGLLSQLTGTVPANGEVTIAVSGFGDDAFIGAHIADNLPYRLQLSTPDSVEGDFNGDGEVDAADYTVWRDGLGTTYRTEDYLAWRSNYGASLSGNAAVVLAPEPTACLLVAAGLLLVTPRRFC